ncbi:hypothetical protein BJY01DRAFT_222024 [Aspergillus pseudoustus]|uniref:Uncharacterized protein n=1 Tax=Aspergillus pseudoustus TaxID=1810923 RepID=A0ABR4JBN3_9EURO
MDFDPDRDIPDLDGKVFFITGGNVGLGKETILQLCKHNPSHIFLAARSQSKAVEAISDIQRSVPNAAPITAIELDLASFSSVKKAVKEFHAHSSKLNVLVNNAGIMGCPPGTTEEGYEIQFGTNHMGHALLTKLLLPTLQRTAEISDDVRIVTLSSNAESWSPSSGYDFAQLKTEMRSVSPFERYGISKIANIHFSRALSRRYPTIRCISVHPGVVGTSLARGLYASYPVISPVLRLLHRFITQDVTDGAKNQLWACVNTEAKSGEFYFPIGAVGKGSKLSGDESLEETLWQWTEDELKPYDSPC